MTYEELLNNFDLLGFDEESIKGWEKLEEERRNREKTKYVTKNGYRIYFNEDFGYYCLNDENIPVIVNAKIG